LTILVTMVRGTDEQEKQRRNLYERIREYELEIAACKNQINDINTSITQDCVKKHGKHDFELEAEATLYGGTYFICKNCEYER
jgi:tRNA(Ser,Leu) C12 N-acetylase TAN1